MAKPMLPAARLRELLHYDPETGVFTRKVKTASRHEVGDVADFSDSHGYRQCQFGTQKIMAHRLAWLYVSGVEPEGDIDHINGNRSDNRIANLRDVSRMLNQQNQRRAHGRNSTGRLGVHFDGYGYQARITAKGVMHYLGYFMDPDEAHAAYLQAKRKLHEGNTL